MVWLWIRFGDGLPTRDGQVGWPVPLNCHFLKKQGPKGTPINGLTDPKEQADDRLKRGDQAQQLRRGHLTTQGSRFEVESDYLLKTALNRNKFGRPKDRQLFEFETLRAGSRFRVALRWDTSQPNLADRVNDVVRTLTGPGIALGRSRSAQFGRVRISLAEASDVPESLNVGAAPAETGAPRNPLHFYLASDLAIIDSGGPRLTLRAADVGLPDEWKLVPERTFLRTRRYSPWNDFHNSRMAERQVIARGSVITFAKSDNEAATPAQLDAVRRILAGGVGEYREEGLGWVMLNPAFVLHLPELDSAALPEVPNGGVASLPASSSSLALANWILRRERDHTISTTALHLGVLWADAWMPLHRQAARAERIGRSGRSQWNEVRQLAVHARSDAETLLQHLQGFCGAGLRRRFWNHSEGRRSLWGELQRALSRDPDLYSGVNLLPANTTSTLACAAIAAVAETMVRRLQSDPGRKNLTEVAT